jgi:hypothetical protein
VCRLLQRDFTLRVDLRQIKLITGDGN